MSNVTEVKDFAELSAILDSNDSVVLKFWATWCGPCKKFAPHFETAADKSGVSSSALGRVKFVSVDVDAVPEVVVGYGIQGVPAVKFFRNGQFVTDLVKNPQDKTVIKLLDALQNV